MPKSAKKKKEKVADFSRAKLKLGKGKAAATNAVDTSFKARSIVLPSQTITAEKDGNEPITRRQLTFGNLLSHLKHYNAGQRKDALLGLRELFDSNWEILNSCLTPLVNALVRLIGDEDASVRKQLLSFLAWMLPRIPSEDLVPHAPLLLLFTTSSQTHIFPEIRIDAIRFLDILLECIPESVVAGWYQTTGSHGSRVLGGYLGILNAGTKYGETEGVLKATSTASVVLTPASKLVVLRSLSSFIRLALASIDDDASRLRRRAPGSPNMVLDASFMRNAFSSMEAYYSFEALLEPSCEEKNRKGVLHAWQPDVSSDNELGEIFTPLFPLLDNSTGEPWNLVELSEINDSLGLTKASDNSRSAFADFAARLANTLHSTIIETYLDCAPAVFSPSSNPAETEVELVLYIARIAQSLYHVILQSAEQVDDIHVAHLEDIVNYMVPYFPSSSRDIRMEELNLIFCELIALTLNASGRLPQKRKARMLSSASFTERVTEYIIRRLRTEEGSVGQLSTSISPAAYHALLPTIWAFITSPALSPHQSEELIHATLDHALKATPKSACKRLTLEFVGRLMLLGLQPRHVNLSADNPAIKAKFDAWFLHLPQALWEIGSNNLLSTEVILRILIRVLQRRPKEAQSQMIRSLQARLVPYFYIEHPTRGALPGPYKKLPPSSVSRVRLLALDVVAILIGSDREEFESLSKAVGLAVAGGKEQNYWDHVSSVFMKKR